MNIFSEIEGAFISEHSHKEIATFVTLKYKCQWLDIAQKYCRNAFKWTWKNWDQLMPQALVSVYDKYSEDCVNIFLRWYTTGERCVYVFFFLLELWSKPLRKLNTVI